MEYRHLGSSGLRVSSLSFGTWVTFGAQIDVAEALRCLSLAREHGVNFFDTAEVYAKGQAEEILAAALHKTNWPRESLVISTKIYWGGSGPNDKGLSRKHLVEGTNQALRRLRLDYVDLLFCHRPDLHTPIEETVWAMTDLVRQGKALYWGTSEWSAAQLMEAWAIARREHLLPPVMEQPEYHMFARERVEKEYLPLYRTLGLGLTTWSPLASGLLTGKYNDGIPPGSRATLPDYQWLRSVFEGPEAESRITKVRALVPLAKELGASMAQLAIAWCLTNPRVSTVILGASKTSQLEENLGALAILPRLDPEVIAKIEKILGNAPEPEVDWRA